MAQRICSAFLIALFATLSFHAQTPAKVSIDTTIQALVVAYKAKDNARALSLVQSARAMPAFEQLSLRDRQNLVFGEACLHALLGDSKSALDDLRAAAALGYSDYIGVSMEPDLNLLRGDADFKLWLADFKTKFGPKPLQWTQEKGEATYLLDLDRVDNPKLKTIRAEFDIDAVLAGARDDYEKLQRLAAWTSTRWEHSSTQNASNNDPLTILREAKAGGRFICMNYAVVLGGTASAYGLPARLLGLLPKDTETRTDAHSVAEVWIPSRRKWVLADGQYGQTAELDGVPLNAVELQDAIAHDRPVQCSQPKTCAQWLGFIEQYLYFFKIDREERWFEPFKPDQLVLIPKGAMPPKSMNGNVNVFAGAKFTSNPEVFYAAPNKD